MIDFSCSGCGKLFSVKDEFAGRKTKCPNPKCGMSLVVPASAPARTYRVPDAPLPASSRNVSPPPAFPSPPPLPEPAPVLIRRPRWTKTWTIGLSAGAGVLLIALVLIIMFGGNSSDGKYFPHLRNGARREYSIELSTPFGGVQKGRLAYRIDGTKIINGQKYLKAVVVVSGIPGVPAQVRYVRRDKHGIHVIDEEDDSKTEYTEFPFPLEVGNSWTAKTPKGDMHYRVEGTEDVYLLDQKYEVCLKVSFQEKGRKGYFFLAPGVGEVKTVFERGSEGLIAEIVLDTR